MTLKISAVIISKNEEKNLPRCFDSLLLVVDEIIVVDSMSSDNTAEICKEYNVKFYLKEWEGYSKTKNYANSLATGEYILSIDADEYLSKDLQKSLLQMRSQPSADLYSVNRLNNFCGQWIKHCGWYPDKKIRLWKNGIAHWEGDVHETLHFDPKYKVDHLAGDLMHLSIPDLSTHLSQIEKYSKIWAQQAHKKKKKSSWFLRTFKPWSRFIQVYFWKLGFLDGKNGYIIAKNSAYGMRLRHTYLKEINSENR